MVIHWETLRFNVRERTCTIIHWFSSHCKVNICNFRIFRHNHQLNIVWQNTNNFPFTNNSLIMDVIKILPSSTHIQIFNTVKLNLKIVLVNIFIVISMRNQDPMTNFLCEVHWNSFWQINVKIWEHDKMVSTTNSWIFTFKIHWWIDLNISKTIILLIGRWSFSFCILARSHCLIHVNVCVKLLFLVAWFEHIIKQ